MINAHVTRIRRSMLTAFPDRHVKPNKLKLAKTIHQVMLNNGDDDDGSRNKVATL